MARTAKNDGTETSAPVSGPPGAWARWRARWLGPLTWLLLAIAVIWIGYQGWRLLFQHSSLIGGPTQGGRGAVDLALRYFEVNSWFSGEPIYSTNNDAVYPPASYLILWPFLGWLSFLAARWLWSLVVVVALVPVLRTFVGSCGELSVKERRMLLLVPLATYPVGATIGNGQLGILVLMCLLSALPLLRTHPPSWRRDSLIAFLFLVALVKPTLAVPFFWVVLFSVGGMRPAMLIGSGYVGITALAAIPQQGTVLDLVQVWFGQGVKGCAWGAKFGEGSIRLAQDAAGRLHISSINLHSVMEALGQSHRISLASGGALLGLGLWVFLQRRRPIWLLLGVVAFVTRFYTYHGWYDDVLLLLPLISLARLANGLDGASMRMSLAAGVLFLAMLAFLLAPGGGYLLRYPWNNTYLVTQSALWLGTLVFLMVASHRAPACTTGSRVVPG